MCQSCLDIDYPVADCWRPCYVSPPRKTPILGLTPGRIYNEADFESDITIRTLRQTLLAQGRHLKRLRAENAALKTQRTDGPPPFEGIS